MHHALGLFTAMPYADVSVTRVAELCEMSPGLLYHYFPSKRALYVAVVKHLAEEFATTCRPAGPTAYDWLVALTTPYTAFAETRPQALTFLLKSGLDGDPEVAATLSNARVAVLSACSAPAVVDADAGAVAQLTGGWLGFVEAVMLGAVQANEPVPSRLLEAAAAALAPLTKRA